MKYDTQVVVVCPFCHAKTCVDVNEKDYRAWLEEGTMIQDAMPYMDATNREVLISGICPTCQKKYFD